ncbi:MAG: hypothetical protein ABFC78_04020 [Methanoregula sp.]
MDTPINALHTAMHERIRKVLARIHWFPGTTVIPITPHFRIS